jgi:peptidoglycan/LPS O-acetylase OafA/YrhL
MTPSSNHILSLTGLRFYAAFLVFVSHLYTFNYFCGAAPCPWTYPLASLGNLGVSLFFVLSGFILYINYLRPGLPKLDVLQFYVARLARVYPIFAVTLLLALPLQLMAHQLNDFIVSLGLSLTLFQSYHPVAWKSFDMPAWSVSVEWTFYLLLPLLAQLFKGKATRNILLAMLLFAAYTGFVCTHFGNTFYSAGRFPINRLFEFLLGLYGGYQYIRQKDAPWVQACFRHSASTIIISGLLALLFGGMLLVPFALTTPFMQEHGYYFPYAVLSLPVLLLLAFSEACGKPLSLFKHPMVILGGEISYSVYLLHHMLFRYVKKLLSFGFSRTWINHMPPQAGLLVFPLLLILTFGLAYIFYRFIERPARSHIMARFKRWRSAPAQILNPLPLPEAS